MLWSPPTRGRGLKHKQYQKQSNLKYVAPHAGAWIETYTSLVCALPFNLSPPTRGRGLKRTCSDQGQPLLAVAPHAGAWIET